MTEPEADLRSGQGPTPPWLRRAVIAALLAGLLLVGFVVMQPFLVALAWAAILSFVTWPLLLRVQARLGGHRAWAAFVMTLLLTLLLSGILLWMVLLLRGELTLALTELAALLEGGVQLPEAVLRLPWLGPWLQELVLEIGADQAAWGRYASTLAQQWAGSALRVAGDLGVNLMLFVVSLLTCFFLFRDGDRLLEQLRNILRGLLGERVQSYFAAVGDTTRAVVYGILLAAITQGVMAGLGYWAAGVTAPAFWGATTALVALIPFGAPLIWGPIGIWLLLQGQIGAGIGLLLWGMLAVSWIDNLVRPLVISGVANIPFLLVLFGVLGGLAAFGLVGLFVGPVILAVLLALWREWAAAHADPGVRSEP
ncbi:AI-2E family transporter [Hydrogenophaga sp.]|uniref:AI-2E family transporter n=1 Tax=Hydrogenophaga sp. TaxID=1904254 RepID=UPI0019833CD9|nr:AI-2E family transporter [Hydrogenophaga sp.]MBD3893752.1 AI-2E family transporter [Hydrogenophaga sp.]